MKIELDLFTILWETQVKIFRTRDFYLPYFLFIHFFKVNLNFLIFILQLMSSKLSIVSLLTFIVLFSKFFPIAAFRESTIAIVLSFFLHPTIALPSRLKTWGLNLLQFSFLEVVADDFDFLYCFKVFSCSWLFQLPNFSFSSMRICHFFHLLICLIVLVHFCLKIEWVFYFHFDEIQVQILEMEALLILMSKRVFEKLRYYLSLHENRFSKLYQEYF